MGWLLNTAGKTLLKKELSKAGLPKKKITPQLVGDLFVSVQQYAGTHG
jgi:hypothetical protein